MTKKIERKEKVDEGSSDPTEVKHSNFFYSEIYLHFVFKVIESSSAVPGWRKDLILEEEVKIPIVCNTFPKIFMVDFPGTSPSLHPKAEYEPDICRKRG